MKLKVQTKQYHAIADSYPMMDQKEFSNLVTSMQINGYDASYPILMFEGKILDGRNRYKASAEAGVAPSYKNFSGTFDEALQESRKLNSFRRQLTKPQKAMIAAKEIEATRSSLGKNLSVKHAAELHAISETYIKEAMNVLSKDPDIADLVFNGNISLKEAIYRVQQIQSLREESSYLEGSNDTDSSSENQIITQEQEILNEFATDAAATAQRMVSLQDQYKEVMQKLRECEARCKQAASK